MDTRVFKEPPEVDERDVRIHHNSDWSGDAILQWQPALEEPCEQVRIPGWVAQALCESAQEPRNDQDT